MRPVAAAAVVVLLFAPGARAQRATHGAAPAARPTQASSNRTSAPAPRTEHSHRPTPSPLASPDTRGPFDARPGTYAPRYNIPQHRHHRDGYSAGYALPFYDSAVEASPDAAAPPDAADQNVEPPGPSEPPNVAASPAAPPAPAPVAATHGPDTFYVIPGCYAGNRPPQPERLPKGCEVAKLRATPVR